VRATSSAAASLSSFPGTATLARRVDCVSEGASARSPLSPLGYFELCKLRHHAQRLRQELLQHMRPRASAQDVGRTSLQTTVSAGKSSDN
jgi:hypothetical protein